MQSIVGSRPTVVLLVICALSTSLVLAQRRGADADKSSSNATQRVDLAERFAVGKLRAVNCTVTTLQGTQGAVHVSEHAGNGVIWVEGSQLSQGMIEKAMELAVELGLEGLVQYQRGDFVDEAAHLPPSAIVLMDKVLCCYVNPGQLVKAAASRCTGVLAVSYPRKTYLARAVFTAAARLGSLCNCSFHPYYHDPGTLHRVIVGEGFSEVYAQTTLLWQVEIYRRMGGMESMYHVEPELIASS